MSATTDILIVGAGIAGLMAADVLHDHNVLLLDKGRGVGGRLATRRIGAGVADHGAQFFTVRDPEFGEYVQRWLSEGIVYEWSRGWLNTDLKANQDGHPRYAVRGGLNALAKHLARDKQVRAEVQIASVRQEGDGWTLTDTAGESYTARALILTPPVPQSLALLDAGKVVLSANDRASLEQVEYSPCLAGMFRLENSPGLPAPGAIQRPDANLYWIADNRQKGISPDALMITAHGSPAFSKLRYDWSDEQILADILERLQRFVQGDVVEAQLKRWRYAQPVILHEEPTLVAEGLPPLAFAGDGFCIPRVEGAALSGLAAGRAIRAVMSGQ